MRWWHSWNSIKQSWTKTANAHVQQPAARAGIPKPDVQALLNDAPALGDYAGRSLANTSPA
jgi:hypothetical protein